MSSEDEVKFGPADFSDSEDDDSLEQAREAESRSFLGRMVAGLGRLVTGSGKKTADKKRRRRRPRAEDDSIEVVPIFHLGADDSGAPEDIPAWGLDISDGTRLLDLDESLREARAITDDERPEVSENPRLRTEVDLADSRRRARAIADDERPEVSENPRLQTEVDLADSRRRARAIPDDERPEDSENPRLRPEVDLADSRRKDGAVVDEVRIEDLEEEEEFLDSLDGSEGEETATTPANYESTSHIEDTSAAAVNYESSSHIERTPASAVSYESRASTAGTAANHESRTPIEGTAAAAASYESKQPGEGSNEPTPVATDEVGPNPTSEGGRSEGSRESRSQTAVGASAVGRPESMTGGAGRQSEAHPGEGRREHQTEVAAADDGPRTAPPEPAKMARPALATRREDTPYGPPPTQHRVYDGQENVRDEAAALKRVPGPAGRTRSLWGSRPHPLFNVGEHPGPAKPPEYEVRHLTVGEPDGADRQSSTPKDDQQTPSGGAEGTSRDGLDGGLPFTFGLPDSGIRHARPP